MSTIGDCIIDILEDPVQVQEKTGDKKKVSTCRKDLVYDLSRHMWHLAD